MLEDIQLDAVAVHADGKRKIFGDDRTIIGLERPPRVIGPALAEVRGPGERAIAVLVVTEHRPSRHFERVITGWRNRRQCAAVLAEPQRANVVLGRKLAEFQGQGQGQGLLEFTL